MSAWIWDYLNPIDEEDLARQYATAEPHHFFVIEGFLRTEFARALTEAYPRFDEAKQLGKHFHWVNENVKVQITDVERFPAAVRKLHEILADPEFLSVMERVTGIPRLLADPTLAGGGMHIMGTGGLLDPHVDFNMLEEQKLHRRLNILVYSSPEWKEQWGGCFDLWDVEVKKRQAALAPMPNRCVLFNTTETSFHGVMPVTAPPGVTRNSFAAYYYTKEAPPDWSGAFHNTIYKTRPGDWMKGTVLMPLERVQRRSAWLASGLYAAARKRVGRLMGRSGS